RHACSRGQLWPAPAARIRARGRSGPRCDSRHRAGNIPSGSGDERRTLVKDRHQSMRLEGAPGTSSPSLKRRLRKALLPVAIVIVGAALIVIGPTACYLSRGAWEEARILSRRRPIPAMIADPRTPAEVKAKLTI